MHDLTVRDLMHDGVVSCGPETSLEEVAARMRERGVSALVVVGNDVALGVISRTDLVNSAFIQPYFRYWRGMVARHLMTSPVIAVRPDAALADAVCLLRSRRVHRLVVTEPAALGEHPIGVLSMTDIVRALGDGTLAAADQRSEFV